jgi:hypothetical protein
MVSWNLRNVVSLAVVAALLVAASTVGVATSAAGLVDRTMRLGSTYTITGETDSLDRSGKRIRGVVTLAGRWDGGRWHVITRTRTHGNGLYQIVVRPGRRGVLRLRLDTPDRRSFHVVLTVI